MFKDIGPIDAASTLLNLTDCRVVSATHEPAGRQVLIEPITAEAACPSCGGLTQRIQARPVHRIKDVPVGGTDLQLWVRKRRMACRELACERRSSCKLLSSSRSGLGSPPGSPNSSWTR